MLGFISVLFFIFLIIKNYPYPNMVISHIPLFISVQNQLAVQKWLTPPILNGLKNRTKKDTSPLAKAKGCVWLKKHA